MPLDLVKIIFISLTGIINIIFAFLVLTRNPKSIINKSFFCISFLYGLWAFCLLFYEFPPILNSEFWIKATYMAITVNEVFILAFAFIFPKPSFKKAWVFGALYSMFFVGLSTYLLFFTNTWIEGVVLDPVRGLQTILGKNYIWWSLAIWGELFFSITIFMLNMRNSRGKDRAQIIYLFSGFSLFGIFATLADIIIPLVYHETKYFSISTIASLLFTFTASYAIIKHRFLDIRLIAARSVAYGLLITILGAIYSIGLFLASTYFMASKTNSIDLAISTTLALFIAFTFQPLKKKLEDITDAVFYKGSYDPEKLLAGIGLVMSTKIELKELASQIIENLAQQMRISKGAFVILGEDSASVYDVVDFGFQHKMPVSYEQVSSFFSFQQIIVSDEVEEESLKGLMRGLDVTVVKTLRVQDKTVAVLFLGEKASGEAYSSEDLKVLDILAPEVAVAIQNSQGYDKIKRFNVTLSDEVKKATTELRDANERLKALDRLKDDFVSIASHELRTPMTAIRSYAWMALNKSDVPLSPTLEKYITRILISTERLINLVNDMLNVSRIESEKIEINPEIIDMLSLIKDIVDEVYYSKSQEKNIQFIVLEKPIPKAFADPDKLRQVFLNLVENSLKFTPDGGSITFDFFTDGTGVDCSIADTGVGIAKEDLSKLFRKFSRVDNSYTAAATSGGTGLGLFISKNLVDLMHGKIGVRSDGPGKGATFTVSLPAATKEVLENADKYTVRPEGDVKSLEPVVV